MTQEPPRPRAALGRLPAYKPGRTAEAAMAAHGLAEAAKLASNELSFGPLPAVLAAIDAAARTINRYPDYRATALRQRLAVAHDVDVDRLTVGCGSVALLDQIVHAYVDAGDEVVFGWPSFEAYPVFSTLADAAVTRVPLRRHANNPVALAAAVTERTRVLFLANPNNPTGTALSAAQVTALVDSVPSSCLVVLDEAYFDFDTRADRSDGAELLAAHPNVVVLRTFSKSHGLAGLRVGYLLGHPEVVRAVDTVYTPFSVNALAQAAALACLEEPAASESFARIEEVVVERTRVARALRAGIGVGVPDAQANFVWLPSGAEHAAPLADALERRGVVGRGLAEGVRVTIGAPGENDRLLAALAEVRASSPELFGAWHLPVGDGARRAQTWLDRTDAAEARLSALAETPRAGRTAPDPGGDETWEDGEAWGHVGEFGAYWLAQLDAVLDGWRVSHEPIAFGRTKPDPVRRAAIASGPSVDRTLHLHAARRALSAVRHLVAGLDDTDWSGCGRHSTLGVMNVDLILEEFLVGHYEQHAAQLEALSPAHG